MGKGGSCVVVGKLQGTTAGGANLIEPLATLLDVTNEAAKSLPCTYEPPRYVIGSVELHMREQTTLNFARRGISSNLPVAAHTYMCPAPLHSRQGFEVGAVAAGGHSGILYTSVGPSVLLLLVLPASSRLGHTSSYARGYAEELAHGK